MQISGDGVKASKNAFFKNVNRKSQTSKRQRYSVEIREHNFTTCSSTVLRTTKMHSVRGAVGRYFTILLNGLMPKANLCR